MPMPLFEFETGVRWRSSKTGRQLGGVDRTCAVSSQLLRTPVVVKLRRRARSQLAADGSVICCGDDGCQDFVADQWRAGVVGGALGQDDDGEIAGRNV